jgi:ZIP family zinc transporter
MTTLTWLRPIALSAFAGSATAVGGAIVFLLREAPSDGAIAFTLSFAAGVMLVVSVFDLFLPVAFAGGAGTFLGACACAGLGVLATRCLSSLKMPEPEEVAATLFAAKGGRSSGSSSGGSSGSSGSMLAAMRVPSASEDLPGGGGAGALQSRRRTWRLGLLLCLILSAHNLPEGIAVGVSNMRLTGGGGDGGSSSSGGGEDGGSLGLLLCAAIFLHNIAEGLVVAVPILAATGDRRFAFCITALSGVTEPVGAALGVFLFHVLVGGATAAASRGGGGDAERAAAAVAAVEGGLSAVLCGVGGVMAQVSLSELLPQAVRSCTASAAGGGMRVVWAGVATGAAVIAATTWALPV